MADYAYYEGALPATTTLNTFTALGGGYVWGGFIVNDSSTSATTFGVQFSYNQGTSFGSTVIVKNAEKMTLDGMGNITQIKLVCGTNANYRVLVSNNGLRVV